MLNFGEKTLSHHQHPSKFKEWIIADFIYLLLENDIFLLCLSILRWHVVKSLYLSLVLNMGGSAAVCYFFHLQRGVVSVYILEYFLGHLDPESGLGNRKRSERKDGVFMLGCLRTYQAYFLPSNSISWLWNIRRRNASNRLSLVTE